MSLRGFEGEGEGCEHPPSMREVILPRFTRVLCNIIELYEAEV